MTEFVCLLICFAVTLAPKKKMGRPKAFEGPGERVVFVTKYADKRAAEAEAEACGLSLSEWMRLGVEHLLDTHWSHPEHPPRDV